MCRPDHFEVVYKINPWMEPDDPARAVDRGAAHRQWNTLYDLIVSLGGEVELVEPVPGLPDMCFTANAGFPHSGNDFVRAKGVVLSSFREEERRGEEEFFRLAFEGLGYRTQTCDDLPFEGAGDAFAVDGVLFLGYGFRTDYYAAGEVSAHAGVGHVVMCRLTDPYFYHLDTCFCPLRSGDGANDVLFYRGAFSDATLSSFGLLSRTGCFRFLEVPEGEARRFACNAVQVGTHVILPEGCPETEAMLEGRYTTHAVPMDQFLKSGGACKCLTLLLGEAV